MLKQKIAAVMQQSFPGVNPSISEWKGQEITDFQEELRIKVNARISEKWFYTHMKSSHGALPRIDMLNFLSRYCGYSNWDDFVFQNTQKSAGTRSHVSPNRYFILVPVIALAILILLFGLFKLFNTRDYQFTFVDADTREPVTSDKTEVILLPDGESPVHYKVGNDGSFRLKTDKSKIRLVVRSPYYQADTIVRMVTKLGTKETVMLKPDDYSMMIHYFSMMKVDDWKKRREQLDEMIDDEAVICQVIQDKDAKGMAIFNKGEFIDKLTMPSGSLKNIEVLNSKFRDGKIMILRFRINDLKK
jgi:hypothetical protein